MSGVLEALEGASQEGELLRASFREVDVRSPLVRFLGLRNATQHWRCDCQHCPHGCGTTHGAGGVRPFGSSVVSSTQAIFTWSCVSIYAPVSFAP